MACNMNKILSPSMISSAVLRRFSSFKNTPGSFETGSKISTCNEIHMTAAQSYPSAAALKLPDNYQDVNASEVGRFSPLRSREICGSVISSNDQEVIERFPTIDITVDSDPHIGPYDCRGAVNLSSSMQSNVPSPFGGQGSILSMPGSQWGQGYKYVSDYQHTSHYLNLRNTYSRNIHSSSLKTGIIRHLHTGVPYSYTNLHLPLMNSNIISLCNVSESRFIKRFASDVGKPSKTVEQETIEDKITPISRKEQLKRAVAAYGSTVIVFHVAISLASLGGCYLLVSSGIDLVAWLEYFGLEDNAFTKKVTVNAGTFVVAYAVHKVFAPVRIGITLTATPFIVRYLRRIGLLKSSVKPT